MVDRISLDKRSWNMSRIKGKDTVIEIKVRHYLFSLGFRYRKNVKKLPGKPDIVLPKYRTAIFIHGCFWHHHEGCKYASVPKTKTDFWVEKFKRNFQNDKTNQEKLRVAGWKVLVLWECEINHNFEKTMKSVLDELNSK